jgi:Fungal Zn(2)-Cys(6) binuclear cluster domain
MGPRSKGCITCKSRKVKCDLTKPTCHRCVESGFQCAGYGGLTLRFVDENPRLDRAQAVVRAQERSHEKVQQTVRKLYHSGRLRQIVYDGVQPVLCTSMPVIAFKDDMLVSFLVSKVYQGRSHCHKLLMGSQYGPPLIIPCGGRGSWILEMAKSPNKSIHALAAMFFGPAHDLHDMTTSALQTYGLALSEMRSRLLASDLPTDFTTSASMTALCMFEVRHPMKS